MSLLVIIKRRLLSPQLIIALLFCNIAQAQIDTDVVSTECDFQLSAQITRPRCPGENNGRIALQGSNNDGTLLQYLWLNLSTVNTSNIANNLTAGNYNVVVFSENCQDTLQFELLDPEEIDAPPLDTSICGPGTIDLLSNVNGGTGNYTINVTTIFGPSQTCVNCDNTNVEITDFTILNVEIFDENGCSVVRPVVVEVNPALEAFATVVQAESCNDNGIVELTAEGGTQNYLYRIFDPETPNDNSGNYQTNNVFDNLSGNNQYTFQVFDPVAGCRTNVELFLEVQPTPIAASFTSIDVSCFGANDGLIQVDPTNANDVMGYSLNEPNSESDAVQSDPSFENLSPGEYVLYVFDNENGCLEFPVNINEPEPLNLSANVSDASCDESADGQVELIVEGGNDNFQYAFTDDPNGSVDQTEYQDANLITNLNPGIYIGYVIDNRDCEDEVLFSVDAPEAPPVNTITIPTCPGQSTGSIVVVESGKLLYGSYEFSIDSIEWQLDTIFSNLEAGLYTLYLRNFDGCVFDDYAQLLVEEVEAPNLTIEISPPSCPGSVDAMINIHPTDNTSNDELEFSLDGQEFFNVNSFSNLSAGDYTLYSRDEYACVFEFLFTIADPEEPEINLIITALECHGEEDGSIAVQIDNGNAPFEYSLNGGQFQPTATFENLGAGEYIILVRDLNGCLFANNTHMEAPEMLEANLTIVDETCSNKNGIISTVPEGGTPPYSLLWSTGDTTYLISQLISGEYALSITDDNGCEHTTSTYLVDQAGPTIIGDPTNVHCFGASSGAIDLDIIGGSMPYEYYWSNGANSQDVSGLSAGNYGITVIDNNQCEARKIYTIYEPSAIELDYESGQAGDEWFINLSVEGGLPPYNYSWSNGETTQDIFNLLPGTYTVTVTDDQNCSIERSFEVGSTSTSEMNTKIGLDLYPNPATGFTIIETSFPNPEKFQYFLLNASGVALQSGYLERQQTKLNLHNYPSGMYILKAEIAGKSVFKKLIVTH